MDRRATTFPANESSADNAPVRQQLLLRTLLFTDIADSTKLKQILGDRKGVELVQQHHDLVRELLGRFPSGEEIETAGDSFLLMFSEAPDAVRFALLLQARLRDFARQTGRSVFDRIGIHQGEVYIRENELAAKPKDLFGIQLDLCARVMALGQAKQILMTRAVFDAARPAISGTALGGIGDLAWLNHGPYLLKGLDQPVEICEAGEKEMAPLLPPRESATVRREYGSEFQPVLGWRPGLGEPVPGAGWILERKLGEGGFGEVWLAHGAEPERRRVFKFCFRADRARSLKREATLFQLLKERGGSQTHIASVLDFHFDEAPFFIEMEFVAGGDLKAWCERQGGAAQVPLETRIEIAAQAAEGLQAAHEAGIIHRDVKPANILLASLGPHLSRFEVKLTDFGIGQVVSSDSLSSLTQAGFTRTLFTGASSSQTGTHLYMAPELLSGKPASLRSDIYSLGVVFYQLLAGDLARPLATGWQNDIDDPLLRDDLLRCCAGNPQDRFTSAGELARNLRALPQRRAERANRQAEITRRERAAYRRGIARAAAIALVVIGIMTALILYARSQTRHARKAYVEVLVAQTRSGRLSGLAGQRFDGLSALAKAAAIEPNLDLRNEAIACLTLPDVRRRAFHPNFPAPFPASGAAAPNAFALDPETARFAFSEAGGRVRIRDLHQTNAPDLFQIDSSHSLVENLRFSRDGRQLAVIARTDETTRLAVWSLEPPAPALKFDHVIHERAADFTPGGSAIVFGTPDGALRRLDFAAAETVDLAAWDRPPLDIRVSPSGDRFAVSSRSSLDVQIRRAAGGELIRSLTHPNIVNDLAWNPPGTLLAAACGDRKIYVWNDTGARLVLEGHLGEGLRVAFNETGRVLASFGEEQAVRLWDVNSRKSLVHLPAALGLRDLTFHSKDGKLGVFLTEQEQGLEYLEVALGAEYQLLPELPRAGAGDASVSFSSDNDLLAAASGTDLVLWDLAASQPLDVIPVKGVAEVLMKPGGAGLWMRNFYGLHDVPIAWETWNESRLARIGPAQLLEAPPNSRRFDASADGKTLAVLHEARVLVFAPPDFAARKELKGEPGLENIAVSPDGRWVAAANWRTQTIAIWDARREKPAASLPVQGRARIAFHPNGNWLASATEKECRFWRIPSWNAEAVLPRPGGGDQPALIAFSGDGQLLAATRGPHAIQILHFDSRLPLAILDSQTASPAAGLCLSHNGDRAAAISEDHSVQVWDLSRMRQELAALRLDWPLPSLPPKRAQPAPALALTDLGPWRRETGNYSEELDRLTRELASSPRNHQARHNRGYVLARLNRADEALDDFQRAIELDPEFVQTYLECAYLLKNQSRLREALTFLDRGLLAIPHDERLRTERLKVLLQLGQAPEAKAEFEIILQNHGETPDAFRNHAAGMLEAHPSIRDYAAAEALARKAAQMDPQNYGNLFFLGIAAFRAGQPEEAKRIFESAIPLRTDGVITGNLLYQTLCLAALGRRAEALDLYRSALKSLMENPTYQSNRALYDNLKQEIETLLFKNPSPPARPTK